MQEFCSKLPNHISYRPIRLSSALLALMITSVFMLSGCSETVRKASYVNNDSAILEELSAEGNTSPLHKKNPNELVAAGFVYLASKNLNIAQLHFTTAIGKDPKMVEAYIGLGQTELLKGNFEAALLSFRKAKELQPDSLPALIGEARTLRSQEKLSAAIEIINTAMMINPDDIRVLKELAMIYDLMGKENLSAPLYAEIVNKSPDEAASHNNLGLNYMVRGLYPEAIQSFLRASELDNDDQRIRNNLASAYLLIGEENQALNIFKMTVGEAEAYNNIGYLYMTQGNYDNAETALKKAMSLNPRFYGKADENLNLLNQLRSQAK